MSLVIASNARTCALCSISIGADGEWWHFDNLFKTRFLCMIADQFWVCQYEGMGLSLYGWLYAVDLPVSSFVGKISSLILGHFVWWPWEKLVIKLASKSTFLELCLKAISFQWSSWALIHRNLWFCSVQSTCGLNFHWGLWGFLVHTGIFRSKGLRTDTEMMNGVSQLSHAACQHWWPILVLALEEKWI